MVEVQLSKYNSGGTTEAQLTRTKEGRWKHSCYSGSASYHRDNDVTDLIRAAAAVERVLSPKEEQ